MPCTFHILKILNSSTAKYDAKGTEKEAERCATDHSEETAAQGLRTNALGPPLASASQALLSSVYQSIYLQAKASFHSFQSFPPLLYARVSTTSLLHNEFSEFIFSLKVQLPSRGGLTKLKKLKGSCIHSKSTILNHAISDKGASNKTPRIVFFHRGTAMLMNLFTLFHDHLGPIPIISQIHVPCSIPTGSPLTQTLCVSHIGILLVSYNNSTCLT